jgi:hypothetical protein
VHLGDAAGSHAGDILVEGSRAWRSSEDYLLHRLTFELMRAEGLGLAVLERLRLARVVRAATSMRS